VEDEGGATFGLGLDLLVEVFSGPFFEALGFADDEVRFHGEVRFGEEDGVFVVFGFGHGHCSGDFFGQD
jgi:hypothetical protein